MSSSELEIVIVTAQRTLLSETKISRATITTVLGQLGVEPGHSQLLAILKPGVLSFEDSGGKSHDFYINGGVVEVQPNKISVIADEGLRTDELNEEAIQKAEAAAREQMQKGTSVDRNAALHQLAAIAAQKQLLKRRGLYK